MCVVMFFLCVYVFIVLFLRCLVLVKLHIGCTFDSQDICFKYRRHSGLKSLSQFVSSCNAGLVMVQNSSSKLHCSAENGYLNKPLFTVSLPCWGL